MKLDAVPEPLAGWEMHAFSLCYSVSQLVRGDLLGGAGANCHPKPALAKAYDARKRPRNAINAGCLATMYLTKVEANQYRPIEFYSGQLLTFVFFYKFLYYLTQ